VNKRYQKKKIKIKIKIIIVKKSQQTALVWWRQQSSCAPLSCTSNCVDSIISKVQDSRHRRDAFDILFGTRINLYKRITHFHYRPLDPLLLTPPLRSVLAG
jgi:hypothetical protein